jgi:hypothetical protein
MNNNMNMYYSANCRLLKVNFMSVQLKNRRKAFTLRRLLFCYAIYLKNYRIGFHQLADESIHRDYLLPYNDRS